MNKKMVVLVALLAVSGVAGCKRSHRPENAVEMKMPKGTPQRPQEVHGLTAKGGAEPFSKDDVTQFIQTHRLAKSVGDISKLSVESVEFITAREVTVRLQGASTGLPNDQRVAFVIIRGPIYFTGPPRVTPTPVAFDTAYAVFDAATGNLLMSGTLEKSKEQPQPGRDSSGTGKLPN